ncbi:Piwi domain-domain-containing protein [Leucosporidium creatinivorum]|uniref:Piwi domain-domain-containing protein n=3 Tax=Leucosporidium creatinivorum TaxID=106004 RepID=A0A1Y2E9M8_9BASI|nr:Piwi domain-domain-containing protein [Leucosporidium creatinivorum]
MPTNAGSPLNQWGLQIETTPMEVPARILPPPQVTYKNKTVTPGSGTWDLRGYNFMKTASIERWMVFVFDREQFFPRRDVQNSVQGFVEGLSKTGIRVMTQQPTIVYGPGVHPDRVAQFMKDEAKKVFRDIPQLFVCYLPRKPCDEYAAIKRFGDQDVGIATQCLSIPKVKRGNPQYYANVAMKVNVKLNGTNSTVNLGPAVSGKPTMIFGADVSHPAPGSFAPSVAALVGTINPEFTNYGSSIRIQPSRVECIAEIGAMVQDLLKQFHKSVKVKPQRLIFFRDGVSEGQFSQVMDQEVNAIRIACQSLEATYKPEITYIVCGKRHHISLFPMRPEDGDRTGNVQAGTTVDQQITSAYTFDWYTQSHASLLGTSRSAHYTVLVDDSKFSADTLQQLVYNLCYTYARCTRSVSYATPAYCELLSPSSL